MRFDHGFSTKEIAAICGVDESTVTRRIQNIADEINAMRSCVTKKDGNGSQ